MKKLSMRSQIPIDRLSNLPEALIIYILSFPTIKEAAITCVLSKKWQFLWSNLPNLELYNSSFNPHKTRRFVAWVNRILAVRTTNSIHEFSLTFIYSEPYDADIHKWIRYAVKNRVKKLTLKMQARNVYYTLPDQIYSSSSLEFLFLEGRIQMFTLEKINWKSLTELCLDGVDVYQDLIDDMFTAGCHVLHRFELKRCFGYSRLEVKSTSLRILVLKDTELEDLSPLEVSAPYIHFLDISFCVGGRMVEIRDIGSLYKARMNFNLHNFYDFASLNDKVMSYTKEIFQPAEELELKRNCFQVMSESCRTGLRIPQTRLRRLEISSCTADGYNISGVLALLESSPNLEKLVVKGYYTEDYELPDPAIKSDLDRDLSHLKTVYIRDFVDQHGEPALTLARILLKRALVLEYMEIVIDVEESDDCIRVYQELPLFPRANIKAKVVIKE